MPLRHKNIAFILHSWEVSGVKKADVLSALEKLGKDRQWLAKATGYTYDYIKNSLAASAPEPSRKFADMCERAFGEEERRREVDQTRPGASVWDLVYFNGSEMAKIDRAKKAGGYDALPALYKDAVINFADQLLAEESRRGAITTPFGKVESSRVAEDVGSESRAIVGGAPAKVIMMHGTVAAGGKIAADVVDVEFPVAKQYPKGHYALRVLGHSMEPTIPDGAVIIVKEWKDQGYPKKGTTVVYNDGHGATLKVYDTVKSETADDFGRFGKVPVLKSINPEYSAVEVIEGGKIDAVLVEVL